MTGPVVVDNRGRVVDDLDALEAEVVEVLDNAGLMDARRSEPLEASLVAAFAELRAYRAQSAVTVTMVESRGMRTYVIGGEG